ncbi:interactor of HORMAD1 protein 1 [Silurus asotus]|uniref:Interactor of HORMAD1 protein 1 n=1 Tax=Silurus asotus TaxID=30991 RepID=A0AAD5FUJ6_SILAS|nr:interactor of HORMAD1 protein 1 [Silurus asotus]
MKPNIWNVKDILNISMNSVGAKAGKGVAASDYSNLPDSQFLFGSQNWPENSQSFSQEISGQSRGSRQASQEINETKVSAIYHAKPTLFGDSKVSNISCGRAMGMLDRFEEEKRKAKETEILIGVRQLHESLENIKKSFLNCIDGSCDITRAAVAEGMDHLKKTIQEYFTTIKESIANQTELLMSQTQREIKDNEEKTSLALKDLSSLVSGLQQDLESLKLEQSKEQSLLTEILSLLGTMMTIHSTGTHPSPVCMIDSTVQTSPGLGAQFCFGSEEKPYESMKLFSQPFNYSVKKVDQCICPFKKTSPGNLCRGGSFQFVSSQPFEKQRRIETERSDPNGWSYHLRSVTNSSSSPVATSAITAIVQDPKRIYMAKAPVHVEPVKSLIDMNTNKSANWTEVPREKKLPKRAQRSQNFRKKKKALILPQRRASLEHSHDEDQENRVPQSVVNTQQRTSKAVSAKQLPLQQQCTTRFMNTSDCGQHQDPWSWSESSNSSQVIVEYKPTEWKSVKPEQNSNTRQRQRVTWQLFDFISDSD